MSVRRIEMYKPDYDGPRPSAQLTQPEKVAYAKASEALIRRIHDAMLTLGALSAERLGGGSSMPEYIHEFSDKVGWDPVEELPPVRFRPTPAQIKDFLPAMALLDGLSPVFLKVVALRAVGERVGGFSFAVIAERFGRPEAWARRVYQATMIQAARRCGMLEPAPKGHAVLVVAVRVGGWKTYLTTAADPKQALYDLRSKSPVEAEAAFVLWTAGKPEAAALVKNARKNLLGRVSHGSWHLIPPEDMAELLIDAQTAAGRPWDLEHLTLPRPTRTVKSASRFTTLSAVGRMPGEEDGR